MAAVEDRGNAAATANAMPRDGLVRAVFPGPVLRDDSPGDGFLGTMEVEFARYNEWTEINSVFEGNFMERMAPTAFDKTIKENQSAMRSLFDHGADPSIGNKVLGPIRQINQSKTGPVGIVPLLDTSYNRDLQPGLKEGVYGASFRFRVMREDINKETERSDYNPKGLPERTITEAQVLEFGPVTFPAYAGASAGMRSLTDRFRVAQFVSEAGFPGLEERVDAEDLNTLACVIQACTDYIADQDEPDDQKNIPVMEEALRLITSLVPVEVAETEPDEPEDEEANASLGTDVQAREADESSTITAAPPHPESPRRGTQPPTKQKTEEEKVSIEEMLARIEEVRTELQEIASENRNNVLGAADQTRWDALRAERTDLVARIEAEEDRQGYLREIADEPKHREDGAETRDASAFVNITRPSREKAPDNVYELESYHSRASSQEHLRRLYNDGAKRAIESTDFVDTRADAGKAKANVEHALNRDSSGELAQYVLSYGSPTYRRAFGKTLQQVPLTNEEQRSLGIGAQGGQMPVPIQIDPTVTLVSNGAINPLRQIARNVTMTGYEWRGVTTTGITASYAAEGAVSSDNSPTLIQPTIDAERASVFVPYSFEVGQDWNGLEEELGAAIADSKDVLEATAFLTGAGHASSAPRGVLRACATVTGTAANTVFAVGDVYNLEVQLPPRFRANASFVLNKAVVQRIRGFDTSGGAALWNAYPAPLQTGMPSRLIGYPVYELSTMSTAAVSATGGSWGLFGDFSKFIIADRIGMSISVIPQLFNGNTAGGLAYPTGQSGLFAFWRNSSDVMSSNAFRGGTQT